jgi:hypothetical protein
MFPSGTALQPEAIIKAAINATVQPTSLMFIPSQSYIKESAN